MMPFSLRGLCKVICLDEGAAVSLDFHSYNEAEGVEIVAVTVYNAAGIGRDAVDLDYRLILLATGWTDGVNGVVHFSSPFFR